MKRSDLWRGSWFGTGPVKQPYVELGPGNFSIGVRVSKCIEEEGLDIYEHGESAYNLSLNPVQQSHLLCFT